MSGEARVIAAHNGARIWGGAERATALLLAGLRERGHRVVLFCGSEVVAEGARALGVPTRRCPIGGDAMLPHAARFAAALRRERPDVLVLGTFRKLFLASLGARLARVPRVVARVGLETDTPRSAKYRFALARWVDAVVVNGARIRPAFLALPGYGEERVVLIPNGVPVPARTRPPGTLRRELGIAPDAPVVGAVARLAPQKRIDRLLRAVALLAPDVHCVLAGDGEDRGKLQALADELGIAARVSFVGHREDVGDVLDALDLLVVASDREGMCSAMLEALAAGVPVVSTPVSGAADALDPFPDGGTPGVVLEGWGEREMVSAVASLLADRARLGEMRAAARRRAAERFTFQRMLDRWEAVLLGERSA